MDKANLFIDSLINEFTYALTIDKQLQTTNLLGMKCDLNKITS